MDVPFGEPYIMTKYVIAKKKNHSLDSALSESILEMHCTV